MVFTTYFFRPPPPFYRPEFHGLVLVPNLITSKTSKVKIVGFVVFFGNLFKIRHGNQKWNKKNYCYPQRMFVIG